MNPIFCFTRGLMMYERLAPNTCWISLEILFNSTRLNLVGSCSKMHYRESKRTTFFYSKAFNLKKRMETLSK